MAIVSIKTLSKLEGQKRIDPEYYQPEYDSIRHKLSQINTKQIKNLAISVVSFGAYSLCNYIVWKDTGVPYLNVENIKEGYIDWEDVKYIDEEVNEILKKSQVKEGQIVLTMAGTIGNAAVAYNIPAKVNSNQATAKITLKHNISPFFISAFLNSYYGKKQTEWEIVTSVQPNIFLWQIKNIKVPVLSEKKEREIALCHKEGLDKLGLSRALYSQARNLLLEELELKDFKPEYELSYTSNLSEAFSMNRVDAEYFQPAYDEIKEKVLNYSNGNTKLLNYVQDVNANFDPSKFPDKIFSYVELADIESSIGVIDSATEVKGEDAPSRARRVLKENDVIISSVEGSLEKVALVDNAHQNNLASTGFFQLRAIKIPAEVLLVLSKSIVLQMQLKKECSGTILTAVPANALRKIVIPILQEKIQKKITSLVQQSHAARKKAKELLEEAKRKVEEAIEKPK